MAARILNHRDGSNDPRKCFHRWPDHGNQVHKIEGAGFKVDPGRVVPGPKRYFWKKINLLKEWIGGGDEIRTHGTG